MMKTILFTLMACIGLTITFAPLPAQAIGLKENNVINSDTITLGDIFYDLPRNEARVLGAAPRPGKDMHLDARTLLRIALALDLPWRPSSNADKVTLTRAATIIEYPQIKEALYTALYDEGVFGDFEVMIPDAYQRIILPEDAPAQLSITKINVGANQDKFEATIVAPSADNPIHHFQVKGHISAVISVPVLTRNIQNGQTITERDIQYIKIKESSFSRDTIADSGVLVGMTARRLLVSGRPIKRNDIVAKQIIERGSLVILSLAEGHMNISTQAKALENGAKGDIIRVTNTGSNKTIHARVIGNNRVVVVSN